jgi:hypothetical protein
MNSGSFPAFDLVTLGSLVTLVCYRRHVLLRYENLGVLEGPVRGFTRSYIGGQQLWPLYIIRTGITGTVRASVRANEIIVARRVMLREESFGQ